MPERAAFTGSALAGLGGSLLGSFLFWAQELQLATGYGVAGRACPSSIALQLACWGCCCLHALSLIVRRILTSFFLSLFLGIGTLVVVLVLVPVLVLALILVH